LTDQFVPKTSPSAQFNLADSAGSFDLKDFAVFDIIDLPVRVFRVHKPVTNTNIDDI
jgi:hypothetical protein